MFAIPSHGLTIFSNEIAHVWFEGGQGELRRGNSAIEDGRLDGDDIFVRQLIVWKTVPSVGDPLGEPYAIKWFLVFAQQLIAQSAVEQTRDAFSAARARRA